MKRKERKNEEVKKKDKCEAAFERTEKIEEKSVRNEKKRKEVRKSVVIVKESSWTRIRQRIVRT